MTHPGGQEDIQDAGSPARAQRIGLVALLALATLAILVIAAAPASADTVSVCQDESCDHETIQDAIDAATPGDTILIGTGVYNEAIQVDKDGLTLCQADEAFTQCGSQPGAVVIDPLGKALYPVFIGDLQAPVSDIVLQGVTVQNPLYDTADQDFGTVDPSLVVIYGDRVTLRNAILQAAAAPLPPGESRWHTTGVNIGHTLDGAEDPSDDIVIEDVVIRDLPASQGADKTVCPAAPCRTTAINNWGGGDGFTVRDTLIDLGGGGCDPAEAPDGHCRTTGATLGIHGSGNTDTLIENTRIDGGPTGADATLGAGDGIRGHFPDSTIRDNVITGWARHGAIVWGAGLTVEANTFQFNGDGLKTCDDHPAIIQDNTIEHATFAAIAITECGGGDEPVLRGNQMGPTNTFALRIESSVVGETFDARLNDWGVVGREAIAERIQDHGQANAVLQVPYLDATGQAHPPLPEVHCFVDTDGTDGDDAPDTLSLAGTTLDLQGAVNVELTSLDTDCIKGHRTVVLFDDAEAYDGATIEALDDGDRQVRIQTGTPARARTLADDANAGGARILATADQPALAFQPGTGASPTAFPGAGHSTVEDVTIETTDGTSIGVHIAADSITLADILTTGEGPGVVVEDASGVSIFTSVLQTGQPLVQATQAPGLTVEGNELVMDVHEAGHHVAIQLVGSDDARLADNELLVSLNPAGEGGSSFAIQAIASDRVSLTGNTLTADPHPAGTGIAIGPGFGSDDGGTGHTITGNELVGLRRGVVLTDTTDVELRDNHLSGASTGVDLIRAEAPMVLRDNQLDASNAIALRLSPDTSELTVDARLNDWGVIGEQAIRDRIQDEGTENEVLINPYRSGNDIHPPLPEVHCFVDTDNDNAADRLQLAGYAMDLQEAVDLDLNALDAECHEGHRTIVLSEDVEAYRGAVIDTKVSIFSQATGRTNTLTDGAASGGARIVAEPSAPALTFLPGSDAVNPDLPGRDGSLVAGLTLELAPGATGILADGLDTDGPSVTITNTRLLAGLDAHATTGVLARNGAGPVLDSNTLLGLERPVIYDATTGGSIVSNHIEANEDVPGLGRTSQGLLLQDTTDALVSGNTIDVNGHPAWTGATIRGGTGATLEDNTITRGTLGIKATGTSNVQLEANTVLVSKLAIDLSGVEGATVTDNRLEGSGFQINPATPSFGIHVHDATSDLAITGNTLSNWDFAAINVASDAGPGGVIDANTLTGTWRFGVLVGQTEDVSITGNDFTGSGLNAINLERSTGTLVEDNTIRLDIAPGFGAPNALDTPEACEQEPTEDCIGEPAAGLWIQGAQDAVVRANSFTGSVDAVAVTTFFHADPPIQPSLEEMSDNRLLSTADSLRIGEDVQELDLDARSNDWGAYECAAIRERIRDLGTDNLVRINPFLTPDGELKGCEIPTEPGVVHNARTGIAFFSIQDAIDAASQDDTLLVGPGAYHEPLTVNKHGLTICQADEATATCGSDPADVIVDAMGEESFTVSVRALDVTLQGITLKNTGLEGNGGAVKLERDGTILQNTHIELEGQRGNLVTGIEVKGVADDALILNSELRGLPAGPEDRGARPNNGIHGELTGFTIQGTLFQGWGSNAVFPSAGTQGISILDNTFRAVGTGVLLCQTMADPVVNGNTFSESIRGILLCGGPGPGGEINLRGNTFGPSVTTALGLDDRTEDLRVDVRLSDWGVNHHRLIDQRVDDQGEDNTVLQIPFLQADGSPEPPLVRIEGNAPSFLSIQEAIDAADPGDRILVGASASMADPTPRPESLTLSTEDIEVCGTVAGGAICASEIESGHWELSRAEWADAPGLGSGEAVLFDNAGTPDHRSTSLFPPDGATIEDIDRFAFDLYLAEGDCSEMDLGGLVAIDETPGDDSHDRDRLVEITLELSGVCVEGEWFHVDFFDEDTRWNFAGDTTRAEVIASINARYPSGGYEVSAVNLVQTDGATVSYVDNQVIGDTVLGERQDTTCFVTADTACRQDTALDRTIVDATSVDDRVVRMNAAGTSVEGLTVRWSGDEGGEPALKDNTLIGVHIAADDVTVEGNQIRVGNVDAYDFAHGVKIDSVGGAKVLGNEIRAVLAGTDQPAVQTNSGIITYNTQDLEVRGNTITGWVSHGGFINTDQAPVIADNTFAENQRGLSICNNEDPHLEGNLFTGNLQAIWFCGSPVDADSDGAGATLRANTFGLDADPGTLVLDGNVQDALIDAQLNDWGVYKCTLIKARINDAGSDNEVDFTPYLDELGEPRFGCEERSEDGDVFVNGAEWASASDPADTASNPVTQATSPVVNPGFEAGISGWLPLDNAPGQAPSLAEHEIVEGPTGKAIALVSDGSGETRVEQRFDVTGAGLPVVLGGSALTVDLVDVDGGTATATVCYTTQACQPGVGAHEVPLTTGANRIELTNTDGEPLVRIVLSAPDAPGATAVFDNVALEGSTTQPAETCDTELAARCANTGELAAGSSVMATDGIALRIQRTEVDTFVVTALDADTGDQVDLAGLAAPGSPGPGTGLFVHALAGDDGDMATGQWPAQEVTASGGVWTVTLDETSDEPIPVLVRLVTELSDGQRVEGFYNVAKLVTPLDELDAVGYPTLV